MELSYISSVNVDKTLYINERGDKVFISTFSSFEIVVENSPRTFSHAKL